jgi:hypothetical protein
MPCTLCWRIGIVRRYAMQQQPEFADGMGKERDEEGANVLFGV